MDLNLDEQDIVKMSVMEKQNLLPHLFLKKLGYEMWNRCKIENWDEFLSNSLLVGPPGAHSRENIMSNIDKFIQKQKSGSDGQYNLGLPRLSEKDILSMVVEICDVSSDISYIKGEDWVTLEAFKKRINKAARVGVETAKKAGTIFMSTGHAESLPPAYTYMGKTLVEKGAKLYNPSIYSIMSEDNEHWLGSICNVTMLFLDGAVRHTHDDCNMDKIIEAEGIRPDLAIADHGFGAAMIRAKIPTILIVDTNDIELIVAACTYPERIFPIPIHDNAGVNESMAMAYYFEHLAGTIR